MITIRENEKLVGRNTFGVEAQCRRWVEANDEQELLAWVIRQVPARDEVFVLGGGSNVLFTADFPGTVIFPAMGGVTIEEEARGDLFARAGAGMAWDDLVSWSVERGLWGLENLSRIPGHVGATPVQNIGAYGVEIAERVARVEAIDLWQGRLVTMDGEACRFGYRDSIFKGEWRDRFVITHVIYRLSRRPCPRLDYKGVREELERAGRGEITPARVRAAITRIRENKLPDPRKLPNAGSFFKNPVVSEQEAQRLQESYPGIPTYPAGAGKVKLAAGWLIEQSGWKGRAAGAAAVDERQALVLVNKGGATGGDVLYLANELKKEVFSRFSVWLEPEVIIL
jgi:UDP-N-acetylmuramate dehydrogenase